MLRLSVLTLLLAAAPSASASEAQPGWLFAAAPHAPPAQAASNQCESLTSTAINSWNNTIKPEITSYLNTIGEGIRTTRDQLSVSGAVSQAVLGVSHHQLADQIMDDAIAHLLSGVSSSWSAIGPQAIDLPGSATGEITPVVGTTRMFISPPNLTHRRLRVTVTKLGGRQRAEVVVCRASYDNPGVYTRVRVAEFANGLANVGQQQTVTINRALGDYVTIKVRKFIGPNAFSYRVNLSTLGNSVLD